MDVYGRYTELVNSMISGSKNGGTVPYKAIFCGDIHLHFRVLKFPLINGGVFEAI